MTAIGRVVYFRQLRDRRHHNDNNDKTVKVNKHNKKYIFYFIVLETPYLFIFTHHHVCLHTKRVQENLWIKKTATAHRGVFL